MNTGTELVAEFDRLYAEADLVHRTIVLPGWLGPQHGLPDTLYGYMMGVFARIDLISAHWRGTFDNQSERMVSFMSAYIQPDRVANALAVQVWRHKLMHTSSPRILRDSRTGTEYRWLLHWGDPHLPRGQHFKLQSGNPTVLNLSLFGLVDDARRATVKYLEDVSLSSDLEAKYHKVSQEIESYQFRMI